MVIMPRFCSDTHSNNELFVLSSAFMFYILNGNSAGHKTRRVIIPVIVAADGSTPPISLYNKPHYKVNWRGTNREFHARMIPETRVSSFYVVSDYFHTNVSANYQYKAPIGDIPCVLIGLVSGVGCRECFYIINCISADAHTVGSPHWLQGARITEMLLFPGLSMLNRILIKTTDSEIIQWNLSLEDISIFRWKCMSLHHRCPFITNSLTWEKYNTIPGENIPWSERVLSIWESLEDRFYCCISMFSLYDLS